VRFPRSTYLVACFQYVRDAKLYYHKLRERLKKFNLELAEEKTRIISFSRFRKEEKTSFTFLGIEFRWGISRIGRDIIKRRTDRKRQKRAMAEITEWCRENRHLSIRKQIEKMKQKLQGHYNYYGISGNYQSIVQFYMVTIRAWYKWLNRRSQRRSYGWKGFLEMTKEYQIPRPKIVERKKEIGTQYKFEFA
jgi:RNA-directed DNA polymerase